MTKLINFTNISPKNSKEAYLIKKHIDNVISKKNFILGDDVKTFENKFSKLSNIKFAVGCASGTDALSLAIKSLNLKQTHEIIVPAFTYISTGLSVLLNNKKLVYADVDKETGLISTESILENITKNTKVIIPVNLYGQKVDLKNLRKKVGNKIFIIEDSAQSHFAYSCYNCVNPKNKNCCKKERNDHHADISCYSFYPAKNLGAYGDAGLMATNNKKIYTRLMSLRNLGSIKKHKHQFVGLNSRLDTIQAAILNNKIKSTLWSNDRRRFFAKIYDIKLSKIKEIIITKTKPGSARHLYVIRTKRRNSLMKHLIKKKINCQIHYPYSLNKISAFRGIKSKNKNVKNSELWSNECLSLPLHPKLKIEDLNRVISEINIFFKNK